MTNWKDKTYYEILRIEEQATPEEIKAAYHDIARVYHPDSNFFDEILEQAGPAVQPPKQDEFFHLLTEAYATLRNVKKREIYDRKMKQKRGEGEPEMRPPAAPSAAPKPISAAPPPPAGKPLATAVQQPNSNCTFDKGCSTKKGASVEAAPHIAVSRRGVPRFALYALPVFLLMLAVVFFIR